MYSRDIKTLFVNDDKTKLYIGSLKNNAERYFSAIEKLCEYGKPVLAAEIVGKTRCEEKVRQGAVEEIYRYVSRGECDEKVILEVLLLLGYREKMISRLNELQFEEIKDALVEIIDFHQEKSDYDFIYAMFNVLSQCEDLSYLRYVLFNQRGKGLYVYNDEYIDTIQDIVCRAWNRDDFELILELQKLLWGGKSFFEKLGLSDDELLETLLSDGASSEQIRVALYYVQDGTDDNNAYLEMLKKLKGMPETDAVRLQRWCYMFKAYRENLVEYSALNDYLLSENKNPIYNIKNDYGALYFAARVFAKLADEGKWPCYHELKRNTGSNAVFSGEVSEILPYTIYRQFTNQERIRQAGILNNRYINDKKKERSKFEMYKFYMTSHFKYVVKLRYVLGMLSKFGKYSKSKSNNMGKIYDWHLHLYVTDVSQENGKKLVCGRIRDCMTEKVQIEVSAVAQIEKNMTCEIKMTGLEKDSIDYECIYVDGKKFQIIKSSADRRAKEFEENKQNCEKLLSIFEKMKKDSVTDEIIDCIKNLEFDEDAGFDREFAEEFTEDTAWIISSFAKQPELIRQIRRLIGVLNEKKINIYDYSKKLNEKRSRMKSRQYLEYYNKTFDLWRKLAYSKMTKDEELSLKKDMAWIFMNSYLRIFYAADDLIRLICSDNVTRTDGFSACFDEFIFDGIINKSGYDRGSIYPLSVYLETGCRFCYEENDYQACVLPDQARVLFRLKRFRGGDVFVKGLREETEGYSGEYEYLVGCETINSVMDEFKKSGLNRKYTYTKLLTDWCSEHRPDKAVCSMPYSMSLVFNGKDIKSMQKNEKVEITGLPEKSNPEKGERSFILSEFDVQNEILRFEPYE